MSNIVPRDKPTECRKCPFCDRYTYDCRLQRESDEKSFEEQMRECPLTAGFEPRPRGRWVAVDSYSAFGGDVATWGAHGNPTAFWYCSFCREQNYVGEDGESLLTDFCPHCGADMREEEQDENT